VFPLDSILRHVPREQRQRWLGKLALRQQGVLNLLMNYSEDAVGAWAVQPLAATAGTLAGEVPALVRLVGTEHASPWIHVLDDEHRLISSLHIATCLCLPPEQPLGQCGLPPLAQLNGATSLTAALTHPHWRTTDWVAVTDAGRLLVGELSHLRLRQALGRSQPDDEQQLRADIALTLAEAYGASLSALAGAMMERAEPGPRAAGE
jgi:Mg/Co/Ni transporter MgtE